MIEHRYLWPKNLQNFPKNGINYLKSIKNATVAISKLGFTESIKIIIFTTIMKFGNDEKLCCFIFA